MNRNFRELKELKRPIRTVGLTGGIASGKTVATQALRDAGFTVIDADEISRNLTAVGSATAKQLTKMFPCANLNGKLERRALRDLISRDANERIRLNGFMHPLIIDAVKKKTAETDAPVIISAPLLFETALSSLCDCSVCIVCARAERIKRLTARDGIDASAAERMIDAQIPDYERATLADFCIPSDGDIQNFKSETVELFRAILSA